MHVVNIMKNVAEILPFLVTKYIYEHKLWTNLGDAVNVGWCWVEEVDVLQAVRTSRQHRDDRDNHNNRYNDNRQPITCQRRYWNYTQKKLSSKSDG